MKELSTTEMKQVSGAGFWGWVKKHADVRLIVAGIVGGPVGAVIDVATD